MSTKQICIRVPSELADRIDRLVLVMQQDVPGVTMARADVARACILRGIDLMEKERGIE